MLSPATVICQFDEIYLLSVSLSIFEMLPTEYSGAITGHNVAGLHSETGDEQSFLRQVHNCNPWEHPRTC